MIRTLGDGFNRYSILSDQQLGLSLLGPDHYSSHLSSSKLDSNHKMASFLRFPFLTTKSGTPESSADKGTAPSEVPIVDPMTFESIADRFETLQADLAYAQDLCDQANIQFDMYRTEIDGLKNHTALLMQQLAQRTAMCKEFHAQSDRHRHDLRKERTLNTQLLARLKTETTTLKAMTNQAQMAQRNLADAKFDIEYLKCTTSMDKPLLPPLLPNDETPLPPRPFVVVLVDGDAYKVSALLSINVRLPLTFLTSGLPTCLRTGDFPKRPLVVSPRCRSNSRSPSTFETREAQSQ